MSTLEPKKADAEPKKDAAADQAVLALVTSLLEPLEKLDRLVSFEEARAVAAGVDSPLLPGLAAASASFKQALEQHAVEAIVPAEMDAFNPLVHERAMLHVRSGVVAAPPSSEASIICEVHRTGLRHAPTGTILRKAVVATRPMPKKITLPAAVDASAEPPIEEPVEQLHAVKPTDTLQGIALRYGVPVAALIRHNKLPGGHALHLRTALLIPPPPPAPPERLSVSASEEDDDEVVLFMRRRSAPAKPRAAESGFAWPSFSSLTGRISGPPRGKASGAGAAAGSAGRGLRPAADVQLHELSPTW